MGGLGEGGVHVALVRGEEDGAGIAAADGEDLARWFGGWPDGAFDVEAADAKGRMA